MIAVYIESKDQYLYPYVNSCSKFIKFQLMVKALISVKVMQEIGKQVGVCVLIKNALPNDTKQ